MSFREALRKAEPLLKNRRFIAGLIMVSAAVFIASLSLVTAENGLKIGTFQRDLLPSSEHILGVDSIGRDIWTYMVYGTAESLKIGMVAGTIAVVIGLPIGLISGYKEGIVPSILSGLSEGFLVLPMLPLLIFIVAAMKVVSFEMMCLILGLFGWAWSSRILRAQVLSLKERDFIYIARASGSNDLSIVFKEILPNVMPYVVISYIYAIVGSMFAEVGLQLIGAAPSRMYTLGSMIYWANAYAALARKLWYWFLPPVILLISLFLGLYSINTGLDEIFNPRLKGQS